MANKSFKMTEHTDTKAYMDIRLQTTDTMDRQILITRECLYLLFPEDAINSGLINSSAIDPQEDMH